MSELMKKERKRNMKLLKKSKKNIYCVEAYSPCNANCGCKGQAGSGAHQRLNSQFNADSQKTGSCG